VGRRPLSRANGRTRPDLPAAVGRVSARLLRGEFGSLLRRAFTGPRLAGRAPASLLLPVGAV